MKRYLLTIALLFVAMTTSAVELALELVTDGINQPVLVTNAADGSDRLFVVDQAGEIRIIVDGTLLPTPFLDIPVNRSDFEGGLLGLAFHPQYASNRQFFVHYTNGNGDSIVSRFLASDTNPNLADMGSEQIILGPIDQPQGNHNGGMVGFGPDGFLYISLGDGGGGGDDDAGHTPVIGNAQDTTNLLGSILRIDVDNPPNGQAYGIPSDNPFAQSQTADQKEIFAWGLRNPFRFAFDPVTGRLFCGDVGQSSREEVSIIVNGGNYGWRRMEGQNCYSPTTGCQTGDLILPITDYGRATGTTVTGGHVYRGSEIPDLQGLYVFGDFGSGRLFTLEETAPDTWTREQKLRTFLGISAFGTDESNELYLCSYYDQSIYKIVEDVTPAGVRDQLLGRTPIASASDVNEDQIVDIADLALLLIP